MTKNYRNKSKTVETPRRPYDRERMDRELQLIGRFGLKNKREVWRAQLALATIRKKARALMIMPEQDPKRMFEGSALLRRLIRLGIIDETQNKLEMLLSLTIEKFLDRRLQTRILSSGYAKSIHHARVLIRHRHIRVGKRLVNVPSFMVRTDAEKHIGFAAVSPFGGARAGRKARKSASE